MYQALYRKYRPKTFDQMVGQEQITQTLKNQVASGRIGHAYLFTGSRGTGKTTCSKIIAKAVNCPNAVDGNPCGTCSVCQGIDDGSILDVVEIDAASNNGVDDIRQLREEASFTPSMVRYRVYIIDETHMLSTAAFNALLKIMEEPPEHVIFILATTEVHKVPATILSRCQRFDFKRIRPAAIVGRLQEVCQAEGMTLTDDGASLIARLCEGGMRDALSLLDVCRSTAEVIDAKVVAQAAGLAVEDCLLDLADAVLRQDVPCALQQMETMHQASVDFEKMCVQFISHYRGLMMAKALPNPEDIVPNLPQNLEEVKEQAKGYGMAQILNCLTVLQDALSRMNKTSQPRAELEMAVIRLCNPQTEHSMQAIEARLDRLEKALAQGLPVAAPAQAESRKPTQPKPSAMAPTKEEQPKAVPAEEHQIPVDTPVPKEQVSPFEPWPQVLEQLGKTNKALAGALVGASAYLYKEIVLIDCDNPFFLELIRTNEFAKESLHNAFTVAVGRDYRMGPYHKDKYQVAQKADPMEQMLQSLEAAGVEMKIK